MAEAKVVPENFSVRVGQDEIGRILGLKQSLDVAEELVRLATRYLHLGWSLAAVDGFSAADLGVDFSQPPESWSAELQDLTRREVAVNLAVRTGSASRLVVVEIQGEEGFAALNRLGEWRADCVAHAGGSREQHYYRLPPQRSLPAGLDLGGLPVVVRGEGEVALAPPSLDPQIQEPWSWLVAPWEQAPGYPGQALWDLLERNQRSMREQSPAEAEAEVPAWDELFRQVSAYDEVLQALLAPAGSPTEYYQRLLRAAWSAGFSHPRLLRGLLWHAPHGDARERPERWEYLQTLVAGASDPTGGSDGRPLPQPGSPSGRTDPGPGPGRSGHWEEESAWAGRGGAGAGMAPGNAMGFPPRRGREPTRFELPTGRTGLPSPEMMQQVVAETLAFMEDRIIMERSRYESMLFEMGKLSSRAADLERRLAECEQRLKANGLSANGNGKPAAEKDKAPPWLTPEYNYAMPRPEREPQPSSGAGSLLEEFFRRNPDLQGDPRSPQMLHFCLKNYIDIDPGNNGLTVAEKMEKAGKLVREFLGKNPKPLA